MKGLYKYFEPVDLELKTEDVTSSGIVTLYASAFGNIDAHKDIIEQGAYTKTIKELGPSGKNRIKHLWQHDVWNMIGRPLEMKEDNHGLRIVSQVSDIQNGDYRKMYQDKLITEHSIGAIPIKEEFDDERGINYIKELKLMEYSAVTWGANPETPTVEVKALSSEQYELYAKRLLSKFDKLGKALYSGTYTDDTFVKMQLAHDQLRIEVEALLKQAEPSKDTPPQPEPQPEIPNLVEIFKNLEKTQF